MTLLKQNKKIVVTIMAVIMVIVIVLSLTWKKDDAVAKINGQSITKDEVYNEMVKLYGAETVDQLIANRIIAEEAKKQNITVSESELNEQIQQLQESYGGEDAFNQALESNNTKLATVKEDLKNYLIVKKLLEPEIEITEEEIKTYFEENIDSFAQAEQVKASHILVDDEETANKVKQKLADGGDFAQLATEYSTDEGTKESGGDLGYFEQGTMVAEFDDVVFTLEVGKISDPVKTDYGYHIIKVVDKKEAKEANYEDSKSEIKDYLLEQQIQTVYSSWLEEKKLDYDIVNTLEEA